MRPSFVQPSPLPLSQEDQDALWQRIEDFYTSGVDARNTWNSHHQEYEQMFRSQLPPRTGPWEGAADLHVQMPYWLVDSVNVRLVASIWNQIPLVAGEAQEDDDQEAFRQATRLVEWHLQRKRMRARHWWSRASKIRLIHGVSVSLVSYASDVDQYRVDGVQDVRVEDGELIPQKGPVVEEHTVYEGPVFTPMEYEDVVAPVGCANLQPQRPSNPLGADQVALRQHEALELIFKKAAYQEALKGDWSDREKWREGAPAQDRSGSQNDHGARLQDESEGINRAQAQSRRGDLPTNPEFETVAWFGSIEDPEDDEKRPVEAVVFMCRQPQVFLGAYRLSDLYFRGRRPLIEQHYQTIGTRFYSMGIMEIVKHLSAELDTIHNMRIDIGQATNLPFFFYRASSQFDPDEIELRPLAAIPVDNIGDVMMPQLPSVTSFYYQEETLVYTLIERVVGVTDLFLGVSPTRGAAARHATGFVGTQQEALARTSEIIYQDAEAFSDLATWVYDLEMQYGPPYRSFRLLGEEGPMSLRLNRNQLWMRGEFDFSLGANQGMYSQQLQQERSQALLQTMPNNPFIMQEPGRMWEVFARFYYAIGLTRSEIETIQGPKEAISQGSPSSPDEENARMAQFAYGLNIPAPVHPSDDDRKHAMEHNAFLSGDTYAALGSPNQQAYMQHLMLHQQSMQRKQMQVQQAQMQQAQMPQGTPGGNGEQDRMLAQLLQQPGTQVPGIAASQQPQSSIPNPPTVPMNGR